MRGGLMELGCGSCKARGLEVPFVKPCGDQKVWMCRVYWFGCGFLAWSREISRVLVDERWTMRPLLSACVGVRDAP